MNGSEHLEEDFSQPLFLCPIDLRKLFKLIGFDIIQRYEQLLEFCTENQSEDEVDLLTKRLELMKNTKPVMLTKKNKNCDNEPKQISKRLKKK